jgi:hypothetical protein
LAKVYTKMRGQQNIKKKKSVCKVWLTSDRTCEYGYSVHIARTYSSQLFASASQNQQKLQNTDE